MQLALMSATLLEFRQKLLVAGKARFRALEKGLALVVRPAQPLRRFEGRVREDILSSRLEQPEKLRKYLSGRHPSTTGLGRVAAPAVIEVGCLVHLCRPALLQIRVYH